MRLAALSYNIPQSYPIFQVEIEKLLVSSAKKCGFSGAGVLFCVPKENISLTATALYPAPPAREGSPVLFCPTKENIITRKPHFLAEEARSFSIST